MNLEGKMMKMMMMMIETTVPDLRFVASGDCVLK